MKTLKILGVPVASFGEVKDAKPAAASTGGGSLPDANSPVPQAQIKFLNARYEPTNITQNAVVQSVQTAIRQAENGSTFDLFRFYRDVLLSDDHIQSCVNTRKLAVLAQQLSILPEDKKNPADVALAKAVLRAKKDCANWNAGMIAIMDGNFWPVSATERLYKPGGKPAPDEPALQYTLNRFVPVNPQLLCYQWAYLTGGVGQGVASGVQLANLDNAGVPQVAAGAGSPPVMKANQPGQPLLPEDPYHIDLERWEPWIKLWPIDNQGRIIYDVTRAEYLDPTRHITHRGHMLQMFRDNWGGPLRAILMWWLFRNLGREWFARGMGRYGSPFPVGYTDAQDPAAVGLLHAAFDLANEIGGLVVDESSRIELKEAMYQGMAQGYETFVRLCNEAISYHITGIKESQKPAGLNAGQSNFSGNVREDVRMYDQIMLAETCQRCIAEPLRDLNGLAGSVKFVWGGLSDADASTFAGLLNTMSQSGFEPDDDSIEIVNEKTGISWRRKAAAPPTTGPLTTGLPGKAGAEDGGRKTEDGKPAEDDDDDNEDDDQPTTLSARLTWLAASSAVSPVEDIVRDHQAALANAFRGALAPVRTIILNSSSQSDAEHKLKVFFADWPAERIAGIVEQAMQICAARGAVKGKA